MENVPVLCCLLCFMNGGSSQCLDLPQYGRGTGIVARAHHIYIVPDYTFRCYGKVTQWGACVARRISPDIVFTVYRPSDDPTVPDCYSLVGFNAIPVGTAIDGCITHNVSESDQISVEPGDVVGFLHTSGGGLMGGIEVDSTFFNITAWYNAQDSIVLGPPSCQYSTGSDGNVPFPAFAAPVITAVVAFPPSPPSPPHSISPAPSTPSPPHSTSSHSPVPSTPSPSAIPSPSSPTQDGGSTLSTSTVAGIAAGAVGGVLIMIIIILLITITILKSKVKDTSTSELRAEMKSNECYATTSTTHSDMEIKNNEAYQSAMDTLTMEQNEAYQSAMDTVPMEQNEAYSGTVVGALQDVTYEEVDGLYEELR